MALVPGAFGARGGIAQYNRDLFTAIAASPRIAEIVVLPRIVDATQGNPLPLGVLQLSAPPGRINYVLKTLSLAGRNPGFDIVFCGHLNLATLAAYVARRWGAKLWLQVHGIEAWTRPSALIRSAFKQADLVTAVSRFTRAEMSRNWWRDEPAKIKVLPNTVSSRFTRGPKNAALQKRFKLRGRRVMLTVSRVTRSDSYKGHDRIIAALPQMRQHLPDLVYLIVGDGDGLGHLKSLARKLGQENHVIFAGHASDDQLVDYYRAADLFVMPSTKEGFGIVFLEAAACGLPVIGGKVDGSWDALMEGHLGLAIDPMDENAIIQSVVKTLSDDRQPSHCTSDAFRFESFQAHALALLDNLLATPDDLLQIPRVA